MANIKLPYVKWREGRPRFSPGPRERVAGFVDKDLRHDNGAWFTLDEAQVWATENFKRIAAQRASKKKIKAPAVQRKATLEALLDDWLADFKRHVARGEKSQAGYRSYLKHRDAIVFTPQTRDEAAKRRQRERAAATLDLPAPDREREAIAMMQPAAIGAPELRAFFDYAYATRGHHMALGMIATISAAFTWGRESTAWRLGANPRLGMRFARPEGRISIITLPEFFAMVDAADAIGRPSIGDSLFLGLFTGQRQTDRLLLRDEGLVDGRRVLRQSKTGVLVRIKEAPQLARRLEQAAARVAAIKLAKGTRPQTVIVDETTGLPYNDTTYRHWFSEVRALAGKQEPGVLERRDQDLRDTFVTMTYRAMSRAGRVDFKAIADVTGHSHQSIETIIKHYLGRDAAAADAAIDTLAAFVTKEMAG